VSPTASLRVAGRARLLRQSPRPALEPAAAAEPRYAKPGLLNNTRAEEVYASETFSDGWRNLGSGRP
jgi:hypothetical protein